MTESAKSELYMITSIISGEQIIYFEKFKEGSSYGTGYYSKMPCSLPGADPENLNKLRDEYRKKTHKVLKKIKPYADLDGSGFITTKEA